VLDTIPADVEPGMYVTSATFARHLRYLKRHHDVVGLDALYDWLKRRRRFDRVPCVITFDDGWEDNYRQAFPLLRRHGVAATVFLVTDRVGTTGMLDWDQVREMEAAGLEFGSHTASHPMLATLDERTMRGELVRSRNRLASEVRRPSRWLCYPKGSYNPLVLEVTRDYYVGALSTDEGPVARGDDIYRVRRIGVHDDVTRTTSLFACRLASLV
jgi:peptidoglycan/xylan/chitin deacetylase (PgdA/CDA1 family)